MQRVKKYICVTTNILTGASYIDVTEFSEGQAALVGGVLESDGLSIVKANRLCEMWNRQGGFRGVKYTYKPLTSEN